jgi:DNA repair protein RecO (recombination protein O)
MSPTSTPAIVLHTFSYGETSKIARLLTRDHGVQSVMAKGASRSKSKFGARLQVLSTGVAQIYFKRNRDLHTLAEFDVVRQRQELTGHVGRYAAATAFAEVIMRFFPAESHPEVFDLTEEVLELLSSVDAEHLDVVGLGAMWAGVSALGFAPRADACARDGRALPAGAAVFSVADGGFLCTSCARGVQSARLSASDRETLEHFIEGTVDAVGELSRKHAEAHRRLVARFIERHVAEGRELKALALWQELA